MRALLFISTLFALVACEAAFARNIVLLRKQEYSGFVPRSMQRSLDCRVLADRVEVTKSIAGVEVKSSQTLTIDNGAINALIDDAQKARLEETRGPVDGPTAIYEGFKLLPTDGFETVTLSSMNGGTGHFVRNPSEEASILKSILDELCR